MSDLFTQGRFMPPQDAIRVIIDDVDMTNGVAHARDQTAAIIQIKFNEHSGGTLLVPSAGEVWTAIRRGYTWYLDGKLDLDDLSYLQPGDLKIEASKTIVFEGVAGSIGTNPWGATIYDYYDHTATGYDSVILSRDPVGENTIMPHLNGLLVAPALWSFVPATRTLTFYLTIGEIGSLYVSYQTWALSLDDAATVLGKGYVTAIEDFIDV